MRVVTTNYNEFAVVFFKAVSQNQENFKITLYGGSSPTPSGTQLLVTLERLTAPSPSASLQALGRREGFLQTLHEEGC